LTGSGARVYLTAMRIISFEFHDKKSDWHLEETKFDQFNLLVGLSGAGKTKIVEALRRVCRTATKKEIDQDPARWRIAFEHKGTAFSWQFESAALPESLLEGAPTASRTGVLSETLIANQSPLVDRSGDAFSFKGAQLPKLDATESAISLLRKEAEIQSAHRALRQAIFSTGTMGPVHVPSNSNPVDGEPLSLAGLRSIFASIGSNTGWSLAPLMALYLQQWFPEELDQIRERYLDIFPSLEDLRVAFLQDGEASRVEFSIKERGVERQIPQAEVSSGMKKVLAFLVELACTPSGSVFLLDELENSLGINCMPELVDALLARPNLQFILTSHHPYIINKIPVADWKVVTRQANRVKVLSARDIPALKGASHHQAFTRLINLPEYEAGIS